MPKKLSILILTHNEEDVLEHTIASAYHLGDEFVVVDSGSGDGTTILAEQLGARVFKRPLKNWGEQRNWGIDQCEHPWIMVLDADELLSPELDTAIIAWKESEAEEPKVWSMRRVNHFYGRRMKYSGLQTDRINRLFHRSQRYLELKVHEKLDAPIGPVLPGNIEHYTYRGAEHWSAKMHHYAERSAQQHNDQTGMITPFHTLVKPAFRFVRHYFLRGGLFDGAAGFHYSWWMARGVALRYKYMKALRTNK